MADREISLEKWSEPAAYMCSFIVSRRKKKKGRRSRLSPRIKETFIPVTVFQQIKKKKETEDTIGRGGEDDEDAGNESQT